MPFTRQEFERLFSRAINRADKTNEDLLTFLYPKLIEARGGIVEGWTLDEFFVLVDGVSREFAEAFQAKLWLEQFIVRRGGLANRRFSENEINCLKLFLSRECIFELRVLQQQILFNVFGPQTTKPNSVDRREQVESFFGYRRKLDSAGKAKDATPFCHHGRPTVKVIDAAPAC